MTGQQYILPLQIEKLEDGRYLARSPQLPGLNVQADTVEEVVRLAPEIARSLIAAMREKGVPAQQGLTGWPTSFRGGGTMTGEGGGV